MVALARLWQAAGIRAVAVVGHSQGEIAAAHIAGALTLDDAARVVALRSQAIAEQLAGRGGMLSVGLSHDDAVARIAPWSDRVSVAAINGPAATVVAGDADALDEVCAQCQRDGVRARLIPVDYASHTAQVEAIRERLDKDLSGLRPRPAAVPFYSTVTGQQAGPDELDAGYWYRNLRQTVQFEPVVHALAAAGFGAFIEVSPHPVVTAEISATTEAADAPTRSRSARSAATTAAPAGSSPRSRGRMSPGSPSTGRRCWQAPGPGRGWNCRPTRSSAGASGWRAPSAARTSPATGRPGPHPGAEESFWAAVEHNDVAAVTAMLGVPRASAACRAARAVVLAAAPAHAVGAGPLALSCGLAAGRTAARGGHVGYLARAHPGQRGRR